MHPMVPTRLVVSGFVSNVCFFFFFFSGLILSAVILFDCCDKTQ